MSEQASHEQRRKGIDVLLDRILFAPLQGVIDAAARPSESAERGRRRLRQQMRNAHQLGQLAVTLGTAKLRSRVPAPASTPDTAPALRIVDSPQAPDQASEAAAEPIDHLMDNYDNLSASQVISMLSSLSEAEQVEIARYEQQTRNRRAILRAIEEPPHSGVAAQQ